MEQHNEEGSKYDLAVYRLETAKKDMNSAKLLLDAEDYRAVHALNGTAYKRHKDAIANFNLMYIRTGIFPSEIGRKINRAEEIRHASDYDDFYIASKQESENQISTACELIDMVEEYISDKTGS